jgi:membrane-bound metal-dependent hydrolase YbcI (DUF457 family)
MLGKTHAMGGFVAWQLALPALMPLGPAASLGGAAFAVWGSYGPDMDHARATWARSYWGGPQMARWTAKAVGGHRMGTHCLLSVAASGLSVFGLLALAGVWIPEMTLAMRIGWSASFSAGWASHVLLDSLTMMGTGWFYPFSRRKFRIGNLRTSESASRLNPGERLVYGLLVVTSIVLAAQMLLRLAGGFIEQA